jgi:hypothetical protein
MLIWASASPAQSSAAEAKVRKRACMRALPDVVESGSMPLPAAQGVPMNRKRLDTRLDE